MTISLNHFSTDGTEISLEQLLTAREERANLQQQLLTQYGQTLLCVTLTAVGGVKKNALLDYVFTKTLENLTALFMQLNITPTKEIVRPLATGHEAFFVLPIDGRALKAATIELEESIPLARLWDLDVFDAKNNLLSRSDFALPPRVCLVCGNEAKICARTRKHAVDEIVAEMQSRAQRHYIAEYIGGQAYSALVQEARLSPKPGLVDTINNGSHKDMNLHTFEQSAVSLRPFFTQFVLKGMTTAHLPEKQILAEIRPIGLSAEKAMFEATNGINTHKGAIFSFGLVCTAMGRLLAQQNVIQSSVKFDINSICSLVAQFAQGLTDELKHYPEYFPVTAGVRLFRKYGLTGARGEAESGFNLIRTLLPQFDEFHQLDEEHRLLILLLHLMATNPDTNVVHRGGLDGLNFIQHTARDLLADHKIVLDKNILIQALMKFDIACIELNLSSGGSADLLALAIFFLSFRGN
ncbi:triphosphoribosyl-dephospho-CoA synthase CitG [Haemophilus parainfluenzae]|uniref:triphosphoribosyl-dephospho-CoA synthase CitG n=1 Tax=Haemophilus parainfluenzae TaxID=729 RepID=UPI000FFE413E|nr:triphosphoribosyl-dephospho-CoA synthase CitG [Haemophilus parainfluenzae]KAB1991461.1 triphosphoribosyl-dephospho-CoA synthase CitG [Haemophilus parainfluenzae]QAT94978.1 triphosphoribosyl-dephospho-CoA synthase CitG [Haemophilus parainfluenzae]